MSIRKHITLGPWSVGFFCMFITIFFLIGKSFAIERTFPSQDRPISAQDCTNQLCAAPPDEMKILHVLPGTHRWGPGTIFGAQTVNSLFTLFCSNLKILGAGSGDDGSTIDCTDSVNFRGAPCSVFGTPAIFDLSQGTPDIRNIEVKGIRFVCGSNCTFTPVGTVGVEGFQFKENRVESFGTGIQVRACNDVTLKENEFVGLGPGPSSVAIQKAFGGFGSDPNLIANNPAANLNHDWVISENTISDTSFGIDIFGLIDSEISENLQSDGRYGMRIRGGDDLVIQENTIKGIDPGFGGSVFAVFFAIGDPRNVILPSAPLTLRSTDDSLVRENLICDTSSAPALRFEATLTTSETALWPATFTNGNGDNTVKENQFLGYNPDVCGISQALGIASEGHCFDASYPTNPTGISDGLGNQFVENETDPTGSCPSDLK